jgi:hypothetical protein
MIKTAKSLTRSYFRKLLVSLVYLFGRLINPKLKIVNKKLFINEFKKSSKLVVVAPGLSLSDLNNQDISQLEKQDIFYINYSFLNKVIKANNFIIEPHDYIGLYADLLKDKKIKGNNIFIKGYASPSRFLMTLNAIKQLSKTQNHIFLMDELYGMDFDTNNDFNSIYTKYFEEAKNNQGFLVYGPSLFYVISFAFICDYEQLILLGFDFDNKYIYCEDLNDGLDYFPYLCSVNSRHTIEPDREIIDALKWSKEYFKKRNKSLVFYKCRGPLSVI